MATEISEEQVTVEEREEIAQLAQEWGQIVKDLVDHLLEMKPGSKSNKEPFFNRAQILEKRTKELGKGSTNERMLYMTVAFMLQGVEQQEQALMLMSFMGSK